jgi:hypothetical protein
MDTNKKLLILSFSRDSIKKNKHNKRMAKIYHVLHKLHDITGPDSQLHKSAVKLGGKSHRLMKNIHYHIAQAKHHAGLYALAHHQDISDAVAFSSLIHHVISEEKERNNKCGNTNKT